MKKKKTSSKENEPLKKDVAKPERKLFSKLIKKDGLDNLNDEFVKREKEKEKTAAEKEEQADRKLLEQQRKKLKQKHKKLKNRQLLRKYLDKAGYEGADESKFTKNIFLIIVAVCLVLSLTAIIIASYGKPGVKQSLIFLTGIWTGIFAGLFILAWVITYIFLDMKIFNRTMAIEDVLPDYLQLASANISAGMPIDRALWFAVRPRFGILAKEIEDVAKSTVSGEDLSVALVRFADKYDSVLLKRSINLLLEGMDAGGEIAGLLNKVSMNIQETRILKKEMAANVMTYAIFIGFATVVAAPVLFGLSGQLLIVIQQIMGMLGATGGGGMMALSLSGDSITIADFRIFSVATLFVTSMFSAFIISIIRKGNIKEGARFIPIFIIGTIILYFIASWALSIVMGGMINM